MLFGIEFRMKKSASTYVYLSPPPSGARGHERLIQLKYYVVLKWQITINLELNAAKNTHRIKKKLQIKVALKKLQIKVIQFGTTFI